MCSVGTILKHETGIVCVVGTILKHKRQGLCVCVVGTILKEPIASGYSLR